MHTNGREHFGREQSQFVFSGIDVETESGSELRRSKYLVNNYKGENGILSDVPRRMKKKRALCNPTHFLLFFHICNILTIILSKNNHKLNFQKLELSSRMQNKDPMQHKTGISLLKLSINLQEIPFDFHLILRSYSSSL